MDCNACSTLCETSPEFVTNGVTEKICTSLQNNTGLNPELEVLHENCEDFEVMNDCLIGKMDKEMDSFPNCDWKKFLHKFIPNIYEYLKALNCSLCGAWSNVRCTLTSLKKLVDTLNGSIGTNCTVNYIRDNSGTHSGDMYFERMLPGDEYNYEIFMDASGDSWGSKAADRDYVCICSNCMDMRYFDEAGVEETYYSSGDTRTIDQIRRAQAMHPGTYGGPSFRGFSWNLTTSVIVKKGEHLKLNASVWRGSGEDPKFRIHQIVVTWIPLASEGFNLEDIIQC